MKNKILREGELAAAAGRALKRSARAARIVASRFATPIYVWRQGKTIAISPEPTPGAEKKTNRAPRAKHAKPAKAVKP
jgi:hypothetical protein